MSPTVLLQCDYHPRELTCQPHSKGDAEFRPSACRSFEAIRQRYPSLCGKMSSRFYDEDTFFRSVGR